MLCCSYGAHYEKCILALMESPGATLDVCYEDVSKEKTIVK